MYKLGVCVSLGKFGSHFLTLLGQGGRLQEPMESRLHIPIIVVAVAVVIVVAVTKTMLWGCRFGDILAVVMYSIETLVVQ